MSTLGLAANQTEYDATRRPVASPYRASSRPWGLDMDKAIAERFWSKVDRRGPGECWEWAAARNRKGYGLFAVRGVMRIASRVVWDLERGPIPDGMWVLHHCDNPPCVRPDHLFLGTALDNVQDMDAKGRRAAVGSPGETNRGAKLTDDAVRSIRARRRAGEQTIDLGPEFGVAPSLISRIALGKSWRHVQED